MCGQSNAGEEVTHLIEDPEHLHELEDEVASKLELTKEQAFALMDAMWHEAVSLGVLPPEDPLEGIETLQT